MSLSTQSTRSKKLSKTNGHDLGEDLSSRVQATAGKALEAARESLEEVSAQAKGLGALIKKTLDSASDSFGLGDGAKAKVEAAGTKIQAVADKAAKTAVAVGDDAYAAGGKIVEAMAGAYVIARDYAKANPKKTIAMGVAVLAIGAIAVIRRGRSSAEEAAPEAEAEVSE